MRKFVVRDAHTGEYVHMFRRHPPATHLRNARRFDTREAAEREARQPREVVLEVRT